MSLKRRLCRLEASRPGECPECGLSPDAPVEELRYEVVWHDVEDTGPSEPEFCETCGRQLTYIVGWADIEPSLRPTPGEGGR